MGSVWSRSNLFGALGLTARESKIAILISLCLVALVALFIFVLLPATADGFNTSPNSNTSTSGAGSPLTKTGVTSGINNGETMRNPNSNDKATSATSNSEIHSAVVTNSDATYQSVTVNGQNIATPKNGTVRKTITADNGTKTDVTVSSHSNNNEGSSSSLELNVNSSNFTEGSN